MITAHDRDILKRLPEWNPTGDITAQRRAWEELATIYNQDLPAIGGFEKRIELRAGLTADIAVPKGAGPHPVMVYLHGGGWAFGSPASFRKLGMQFAEAGYLTIVLDYRLAPEHPFPAALDDALGAYQWLLGRGIAPGRIVVAGDSAGGGLTVALLLALRERALPRPAAGVCISPWVDLTCSGASYATKAAVDPIVTREGVGMMAQAYAGSGDPKAALLSPLYGDLHGLPPLLVQVGSDEVLLDDAVGLADRAKAAGVSVTLEEWPAMIHVWHWFLPMLAEAERAIGVIGGFVRARIG
jgi:phosphinothricin tripeptide acetyl hydrolase